MSDPLEAALVEGFVDVVIANLRCATGLDAERCASGPVRGIAVSLDFRGDIHGPMTWVFPEEVALQLVRRMLAIADPAPELATAGATELANILTGRAITVLEKRGFHCELGVPRLHVGELPSGVNVRMATADGPIDLVLGLASTA
ncbi:MAG TPA: chemotaxis protein CheX [Kofleriaceae bacterium]